ncbi:hypothetical protein ACWEOI_18830 [Nocardia sp. NPDC004340]
MKRFAAVLTVGAAVTVPFFATATASADTWQPIPGISIPLPDGLFTGSAGVKPSQPPAPAHVQGEPCDDGRGTWVHLDGGNAAHYGTEWLCKTN